MNEILSYFPNSLKKILEDIIFQNKNMANELQEIRIRNNRPVILKLRNRDIPIDYIVKQTEVLQTLERLCENSIYAYKKQLCEGFLTIKGRT